MLWEELRSEEFKEAIEKSAGVCVVPIGCVETHGRHLPLGCDVIQAKEITRRAAEKEPVCVFPAMYFGEKSGAGEFPGTIIFSSKLIFDILTETCAEIGRNGFKKIMIVNSHGGNIHMVNNFVRSVVQKKTDYLVFACNTAIPFPKTFLKYYERTGKKEFPDLTDYDLDILRKFVEEKRTDGHAGVAETAWLYDICPELVRLDKIDGKKGESTHRFDKLSTIGIYTPFAWMGDFPNSYACDGDFEMTPTLAAALTKYSVDKLAHQFEVLKEEDISVKYHSEWLKSW